ncbi:RICIN domain-containing protein, partial [Streptomyces tibetensis]
QWNVNTDGTITGVHSGLCLDANAAGTANGTKITLWSCNGGTNQQWNRR